MFLWFFFWKCCIFFFLNIIRVLLKFYLICDKYILEYLGVMLVCLYSFLSIVWLGVCRGVVGWLFLLCMLGRGWKVCNESMLFIILMVDLLGKLGFKRNVFEKFFLFRLLFGVLYFLNFLWMVRIRLLMFMGVWLVGLVRFERGW